MGECGEGGVGDAILPQGEQEGGRVVSRRGDVTACLPREVATLSPAPLQSEGKNSLPWNEDLGDLRDSDLGLLSGLLRGEAERR